MRGLAAGLAAVVLVAAVMFVIGLLSGAVQELLEQGWFVLIFFLVFGLLYFLEDKSRKKKNRS